MCIYRGCAGSSLLCGLSSSCGERGSSPHGVQASRCCDSCWGAQAPGRVGSVVAAPRLQSTDSVVMVLRLSCSAACGFPDQESNLRLLHWQADSSPPSYQGSPFLSQRFIIPQSEVEWNTLACILFPLCGWQSGYKCFFSRTLESVVAN